MKATEFVKECGVDVAKRTLSNAIGFGCSEIDLFGGKYIFRTDDLKEIVDAFELVESYGGIHGFKTYCNGDFSDSDLKTINLVEQCQND